MNTRPLTAQETAILTVVRRVAEDYALIFVTKTGLQKSIFDATAPLRTLLKDSGFHDYGTQQQGRQNKVLKETRLLMPDGEHRLWASLYRPTTKKGDPRIWFKGLRSLASPDDVLVVFIHHKGLHILDLSLIARHGGLPSCPVLRDWLERQSELASETALELLYLLKELAAQGPIRAIGSGDTAIGRTLEAMLNIPMNSRKAPDYRGIEIKSARQRRNRHQLFAQVPDWSLSHCKNFTDFIKLVGYEKSGRLQLNCTVSTRAPNGQGLQFKLLKHIDQLVEYAGSIGDLAVWRLATLHKRLLEKHRETFWVYADTEMVANVEWFCFRRVTHTSAPSAAQFDHLLELGRITMDHQMKWLGTRAHERGPSFKLQNGRLDDLFVAKSRHYDLL